MVTILIVNYKTHDLTKECIKSIINITKTPTYNILVFDNNSNDKSLEYLQSLKYSNFALVENSKNIGHGAALQQLSKIVNTKYMCALDSDAWPIRKDWLEYMISKINDKIKCIAPIHSRGFAHPSTLLIETEVFKKLSLTFENYGSVNNYGKKSKIAWDVGEKITWDLLKNGYDIYRGHDDTKLSDLVYHKWEGTIKMCRDEGIPANFNTI